MDDNDADFVKDNFMLDSDDESVVVGDLGTDMEATELKRATNTDTAAIVNLILKRGENGDNERAPHLSWMLYT